MRIIHCADLHLDSKMTTNLPAHKAKERRQEILITFYRMVEFADENQVDAVLIAGDLFDRKNCSVASVNTVLSIIRDNPRILFFYLRGNHDRDTVLKTQKDLPSNLLQFSDDHWTAFSMEEGKVFITGVELTPNNNRRMLDELKLREENYNLLVLHGQMEEGFLSEIPYKAEAVIPLKSLRNRGIDYLALGHVHKREAGKLDGRGIWCYPGCLEGRGFDECGEHGCFLLDIDPVTHQTKMAFVPLCSRTFHEITVDISDCRDSHEILQTIKKNLDEHELDTRDLIKIVLVGEAEVTSEITVEYLDKQLEHLFYFVKIENKTRLRVDYREYLLDPTLKGEFVRMVGQDASLSEEEKKEVIGLGIRLLMGVDRLED